MCDVPRVDQFGLAVPTLEQLSILLRTGGSQAAHSADLNRALPTDELFHRDRISCACLVEGQQSAPDCRNDFGLSTDGPAHRLRCGQPVDGELLAERTDDVGGALTCDRPVPRLREASRNDAECLAVPVPRCRYIWPPRSSRDRRRRSAARPLRHFPAIRL